MTYDPTNIFNNYGLIVNNKSIDQNEEYVFTYENIANLLNVFKISRRGNEWTAKNIASLSRKQTSRLRH